MKTEARIPERQNLRARATLAALFAILAASAAPVRAEDPARLAQGFTALPADAKVLIVSPDVELFQLTTGGVLEPKADWTSTAQSQMLERILARQDSLRVSMMKLEEAVADDLGEQLNLHAAVANAILVHHFGAANFHLPSKEGNLDWSFGDALHPLRDRTGAGYALFTFVRDSYATTERKVTSALMAVLGAATGVVAVRGGGRQVAYASLVDLETGRVLWFNWMGRASGDLRDAAGAEETIGVLFKDFPAGR
jgi:hypothetical protein